MAMTDGSDNDGYDDVLIVFNKISPSFQQRILDSIYLHHVCYKKKLLDSLKNREGVVHLSDRLSCTIKDERTVSLKLHNRISKK